jgi:hypothetical protein
MKLLRAVQFASFLLATFVNLAAPGFAQSTPAPPLSATSAAAIAEVPVVRLPVRAFPALNLGRGLNLA